MSELFHARKSPEFVETLLKRRSASAKTMGEPGPSPDQINTILAAGMRVPDHGKLHPWWFIVFEGDDRAKFGDVLKDAWAKREPNATAEKLEDERKRFLRVPLVIGVISSPRESTIPVWEQHLSAGAACQNLCLAANALGFGTNWLTNWCAYDDNVRAALKLRDHENVAGFIYIGTPMTQGEERDRPDPAKIINRDFQKLENRGDDYAKKGLGFKR